jgi:hypothetical protein
MSLLKHLEDEAEHLLDLVKHMVQVQLNMQGVVSEATQKIHDILDAHVNPPATVDPAPVPVPPVVTPDTNTVSSTTAS